MKQNYAISQYIQIAKEEFCKVINTIPFVSDIEILSTGLKYEIGDFYVDVHFSNDFKPQRFCVEVKSNGEKRFVNKFISIANQKNYDFCYVFMAPYISEASSDMIIENKLSYMDLSGNCYLLAKHIILHYKGNENKYIDKREKKNYLTKTSGAASTILRTILNEPEQLWQVQQLANKTDKALGTVSNVKKFLLDRDWIDDTSLGFRVKNIKELFHTWATDYHKKDARIFEFYSFDSIPELERKISNWSMSHDYSGLLGGFSAAARYAPTVRYKKVEAYVEQQAFSEFVKDLDLQPVDSGGNVIIIIPHDETPGLFMREINGYYVTSPTQTVLDLLGNPGRGEEAAEAVITKEFKES